jgi:SAM-dependent methyltransferase
MFFQSQLRLIANPMSAECYKVIQPQPDAGIESPDPLAIFLADPESHLSDILYLYFRIYKKKLLWKFMQLALRKLNIEKSQTLFVTDVGASMGFDILYLLRKLTRNFCQPLPIEKILISLVEGDQNFVAAGQRIFREVVTNPGVDVQYYHYPLGEGLPLANESQHLVICSEVVEHLEEPENLMREIRRVLKPGGFLMFTTDNSPSFLQRLRRIPVWLSGNYRKIYSRPSKESETVMNTSINGREYPIFGHINLNPTRHWENLSARVGFELASYGTYESIRRGGGSKSPLALAAYFFSGTLVYYLLPRKIGRYFGDTTALLLRKSER